MTHSPPQWRTVAEFWVAGEPAPQPRPRGELRKPKTGSPFIHIYTPSSADRWKKSVAFAARPFIPHSPITAPLSVDLAFYIPRPLYMLERKWPNHAFPCISHRAGDRDNLDKPVLDALTKAGMWADDCQVCDGRPYKLWAAKGGASGCMVTIRVLREAAVQQVFFQPLENTK